MIDKKVEAMCLYFARIELKKFNFGSRWPWIMALGCN